MFDPHERYFTGHNNAKSGLLFNFRNPTDQHFFAEYPDQFKPYTQVNLGNDIAPIDFQSEFQGTLFRFPIRNEASAAKSELSNNFKPLEQLIREDVVSSFLKDLHLILLFLRCLEKVEIWEKRHGQTTLLASTSINFEKSDACLREKRASYLERLKKCVDPINKTLDLQAFKNLDDIVVNFKMVIDTVFPDNQSRSDEYLLSHFVKFKSCSDNLSTLAKEMSNIPICGVAYKLNDAQFCFKDSRYFCFLPMPEKIEKNGLPFHINGSFGLRDDRSDFKWLTNDNRHDRSAIWNQHMVDEVLNLTLIQMIDYAKAVINEDIEIDNFYSLFPRLNDIGLNWRENYLQPYFNELNKTNLILNKSNNWIHIRNAYLTNRIEEKIEWFINENGLDSSFKLILSNKIFSLFDPHTLSQIATPQHILEIYGSLVNLVFIDVESICQRLVGSNLQDVDSIEKETVINFLFQSMNSLSQLNKVELLPLVNKTWRRFGINEDPAYIYDLADDDLKQFFHSSPSLQAILLDYDALSNKTKNKLAEMLPHQQFIKYNHSLHFKLFLEKIFEEKLSVQEKICQAWSFVCKYFANNLEMFSDLKALPFSHNDNVHFFSLNQPGSSDMLKFFAIDKRNSITSNEILGFFTKHGVQIDGNHNLNGCILFEDLHGLEKHSQLVNFIPQFSLIDAIVHLNKCLTKLNRSMTDFINENMSSELKSQLINDLNTAIRVANKSSLNKNFETLIDKLLPLFKIYEGGEATLTSSECGRYTIPSLALQNKLRIDSSLKLIDLSQNESKSHLANFLQLKEYPMNDLLQRSLNFHLSRDDLSNVKQLIEYVLKNDWISQVDLIKMRVFKNKANEWSVVSEIYDNNNTFVREFVPSRLHLHEDFSDQLFYASLKPHLSVAISVEFFQQYLARNLSSVQNQSVYTRMLDLVFQFLASLDQTEKQKYVFNLQ
jgi:hypothetical protein